MILLAWEWQLVIWRNSLVPKRIDKLTREQRARFDEWAHRWIEIGLRTGSADRSKFEKAVRDCYHYAGLEPPKIVVWTTSPLVVALAGPVAALTIELIRRQVKVGGAVRDAVSDAVGDAVRDAIGQIWAKAFVGQFAVGGWWWGGAWTSFFREVCDLELENNLWERARAYEATLESACWWWPHREFVIVSERPTVINRELVNPQVARGFGSHRLHSESGPACGFRDGWGVWSWHGVRVRRYVVEHPGRITLKEIKAETNAEVRRVLIERYGLSRYLLDSGAVKLCEDEFGELYKTDIDGDEPLVMVKVMNSTPEPGGSFKAYFLRVHPELRPMLADKQFGEPQFMSAINAVASTFRMRGAEYLAQLAEQS